MRFSLALALGAPVSSLSLEVMCQPDLEGSILPYTKKISRDSSALFAALGAPTKTALGYFAIASRALDKAAVAFRQAGKADEGNQLSRELRERYPNYAGG
jgi:hypothetical protein